jgi:hypothetical protein
MARGNRATQAGTRRRNFSCDASMSHRDFLLKFARGRNKYRTKLRQHLRKYSVWLLDYCLTS